MVEEESSRRGSYFTGLLTRVGGVFLAPDATFSRIVVDKVQFWEPLMLMLLLVGVEGAILISFCYRILSAVTTSLSSIPGFVSFGFLYAVPWIMFISMLFGTLLLWVILTFITHIGAKYIFHGKGSFLGLMKLYGYSLVPAVLAILGSVLFGISWVAGPLVFFLDTIAIFWTVLLMAVATKHNYDIDIGKAFISSFVGPMTVCLIIVGMFWVWMWLVISSLAGGLA